MKKIPKWQIVFGISLIAFSTSVYYWHFLIFRDAHHIFIYLIGDVERVYSRLISEWLDYTSHLKKNYPYLFSLAMRTNPFDSMACVIVE